MNLKGEQLAKFVFEMCVLMFLKSRNGTKTTENDLDWALCEFSKIMDIREIPIARLYKIAKDNAAKSDIHEKAFRLMDTLADRKDRICPKCQMNQIVDGKYVGKVSLSLVCESTGSKKISFDCPEKVYNAEFLREELIECDREKFICLHLSARNEIISYEIVSIGSLNSSIVHPREVFKGAILANACAVIVCHNHPSGDPKPSCQDISITKGLIKAGELIGIDVLDHIVFGNPNYVSLKEEQLI